SGKAAWLVEDDAVEISVQAQLADLVGVEGEVMAGVHIRQVKLELLGRALTAVATPPVGQKDTADVGENRLNRRFRHAVPRSTSNSKFPACLHHGCGSSRDAQAASDRASG